MARGWRGFPLEIVYCRTSVARRGANEKTKQAEVSNGTAHAEWLAEIDELKQRLRDRAEAIGRASCRERVLTDV